MRGTKILSPSGVPKKCRGREGAKVATVLNNVMKGQEKVTERREGMREEEGVITV